MVTLLAGSKRDIVCNLDPAAADTVASAVWSATPVLTLDTQRDASLKTTIRASGFVTGIKYEVRASLTGVSGQIYPGDIVIACVVSK